MLFILRNLISFIPLLLAIVLAILGNAIRWVSAGVMESAIWLRDLSCTIAGDQREPPMPFHEQQRTQLRVVGRRRPMTPPQDDDSLPN